MSRALPAVDSELGRVRFAARAGALVIAALFCLIAIKPFHGPATAGHDEAGVVSVISIDISPAPPTAPVRPPPEPRVHGVQIASVAAQPAANASHGEALDLWVDQSGRLIFNSADKYQAYRRCRSNAAATRRNASACDAIAAQATPEVALNRPVTHGWH